jgi:hypothetical protein
MSTRQLDYPVLRAARFIQEQREARAYVRLDDAQTERRIGIHKGEITNY